MNENSRTLKTGIYTIELSDGPSHIYKTDSEDQKVWVASTTDPDQAMLIVEGLILVEQKRFYYPNSEPDVSIEPIKPVPPFLKRSQ